MVLAISPTTFTSGICLACCIALAHRSLSHHTIPLSHEKAAIARRRCAQ